MAKVLIIEDEPNMVIGLKDSCEYEGYEVSVARNGKEGLEKASTEKPDIILLDVMLPLMSGIDVCRTLRTRGIETPIVMLTARGQETDKVVGLEVGADDYVTKPFSIKELLARADALLRRRRTAEQTQYSWSDCHLDLTEHTFSRNGEVVALSPKEWDLLRFLVTNARRALSRDTIMSTVWGYDCAVTPRSIDRFITMLRHKIEPEPAHPRFIQTIREFGYRFDPEGKIGG